MKDIFILVTWLLGLASAVNHSREGLKDKRGSCDVISYGTCDSGYHKYGAYHWKNHCAGQIVDLKASKYYVKTVRKGLSFDACAERCAHVTVCCATNYDKCGGVCKLLARTDGTDHCYHSPIVLTEGGRSDQSCVIIPPSEVPGSVYGGH